MLHSFLAGSLRRFRRIPLGFSFSDRCRLFRIAVLQGVPVAVRKRSAIFDSRLDSLTDELCSSTAIKVKSVIYALRDYEDLYVVDSESFVQPWFQLKRGDVFVDLGSHVGKYAVLAAAIVQKEGCVIAVEPNPESFKALEENVKLNHLENVVAFNLAAWNRSEILKFSVAPLASQSSIDRNCSHHNSIDVLAKSMDQLLLHDLKLWRVDCIKIDVEKVEVEVLQGLEETLTRFKPNLILEVWDKNIPLVKEFLKRHGYNMIAISNKLGSTSEWCVYVFCTAAHLLRVASLAGHRSA